MIINEKGTLTGVQAFLMEAIKGKDALLEAITAQAFNTNEFQKEFPYPEMEEIEYPTVQSFVTEEWGWDQLTAAETAEYIEAEAKAAHIGQFIHKTGKLSHLRRELPLIKTLEWMEIKAGQKTPVVVALHHTPADLMLIHEEFATIHREYEQKVNYFKAKVKNLVTTENARIAKENAKLIAEYNSNYSEISERFQSNLKKYRNELDKAMQEFEGHKESAKKEVVAMRIVVDKRFQSTIDEILKSIKVDTGAAEA
jgi:hypothetical protein